MSSDQAEQLGLVAEELRASVPLPDDVPVRMEVAETPLIDISSRDLRRRVVLGRSLRYFLPRAVEIYIQEKQIYRGAASG